MLRRVLREGFLRTPRSICARYGWVSLALLASMLSDSSVFAREEPSPFSQDSFAESCLLPFFALWTANGPRNSPRSAPVRPVTRSRNARIRIRGTSLMCYVNPKRGREMAERDPEIRSICVR
jgi:hypothetical protein